MSLFNNSEAQKMQIIFMREEFEEDLDDAQRVLDVGERAENQKDNQIIPVVVTYNPSSMSISYQDIEKARAMRAPSPIAIAVKPVANVKEEIEEEADENGEVAVEVQELTMLEDMIKFPEKSTPPTTNEPSKEGAKVTQSETVDATMCGKLSFNCYFDNSDIYFNALHQLDDPGGVFAKKVSQYTAMAGLYGEYAASRVMLKMFGSMLTDAETLSHSKDIMKSRKDKQKEKLKAKYESNATPMEIAHAASLFAADSEFFKLQTCVNADLSATIRWGSKTYTGNIESMKSDFTVFSLSGAPLRAKVSITMSFVANDVAGYSEATSSLWSKFKENFGEEDPTKKPSAGAQKVVKGLKIAQTAVGKTIRGFTTLDNLRSNIYDHYITDHDALASKKAKLSVIITENNNINTVQKNITRKIELEDMLNNPDSENYVTDEDKREELEKEYKKLPTIDKSAKTLILDNEKRMDLLLSSEYYIPPEVCADYNAKVAEMRKIQKKMANGESTSEDIARLQQLADETDEIAQKTLNGDYKNPAISKVGDSLKDLNEEMELYIKESNDSDKYDESSIQEQKEKMEKCETELLEQYDDYIDSNDLSAAYYMETTVLAYFKDKVARATKEYNEAVKKGNFSDSSLAESKKRQAELMLQKFIEKVHEGHAQIKAKKQAEAIEEANTTEANTTEDSTTETSTTT